MSPKLTFTFLSSIRKKMELSTNLLLLLFAATSFGEYTDPHCNGKQVIVHLFEWKWTDVALECERYLSKKGFCGVQVSPANEHIMVTSPPRPWWEKYQPVSYKLHSRSGTETEFADMVARCKKVGVRIYVDVVLNHMAALGRSGIGTAGSRFDADKYEFPGVPYVQQHFNPYCTLNSSTDENNIKNCYLYTLTDLDQMNEYVRNKIAAFLNALVDYGVAGFRVDAARHMWPRDISAIQQKLKDLPEGGRPFFYHEVYDNGNSPITTQQYTSLGYVTEFRYCLKLKDAIVDFRRLNDIVDYNQNMTDSRHALVFVDNHDNVRNKGSVITFENATEYKMAVAFTLANDYGFVRVMSNYYFGENFDLGPPHNFDYSIKDVTINRDNISCGNGWVCEHRWRPVANMVAFRNAVVGTKKEHYYNQNNQVAFSRGNEGFFAMARDGHMNKTLQTGLPAGEYCDLVSECSRKITVDGSGMANIMINNEDEPIIAFIVGNSVGGTNSTSSTSAPRTHSTVSNLAVYNTTAVGASSTTANKQTNDRTLATPDTTIAVSASLSTPIKTTFTTLAATTSLAYDFKRTVMLIERRTKDGEDLFIRGGFDLSRHTECTKSADASNPCAIPIRDRHIGNGTHYAKYNAWSVNDSYLDWSGAEPNQGRFNGVIAQGTPAVWTTDKENHPGHSDFNTYGDHFWLVDVDMDCSKTENGWFEFKAIVNGQWEGNIRSGTCGGSGAGTVPAQTQNHWAKCGMLNIFHFDEAYCEIKNIS